MTYYYYRLTATSTPIQYSNFSSTELLADNDLVRFLSYGDAGYTLSKEFLAEGYYVRLDENDHPIPNTLEYGRCECPKMQRVFIPIKCDEPEYEDVYYGIFDTIPTIDLTFIESGNLQKHLSSTDITIVYNTTTPTYHWVAWPSIGNSINGHYINPLDTSVFGTGNTFITPVSIGDYYFTRTDYPTQITFVNYTYL